MAIPPVVRHMILCDAIAHDLGGRPKVDVRGVTHTIVSKPPNSFPIIHPELCVFLMLTGGVGTGRCRITVVSADSGDTVAVTPEHEIAHPADRHSIHGVLFRVQDCVFRKPGLYWVEFRQDGLMVQRVPLVVR